MRMEQTQRRPRLEDRAPLGQMRKLQFTNIRDMGNTLHSQGHLTVQVTGDIESQGSNSYAPYNRYSPSCSMQKHPTFRPIVEKKQRINLIPSFP